MKNNPQLTLTVNRVLQGLLKNYIAINNTMLKHHSDHAMVRNNICHPYSTPSSCRQTIADSSFAVFLFPHPLIGI